MLLTDKRMEKGWSKSELARRAKLNVATVIGVENRRLIPYDSQLRKLAKALGMPEEAAGGLVQDAPQIATAEVTQ